MSRVVRRSPWLIPPEAGPGARVQLFCFPYAGGGGWVFRTWRGEVPGVDVRAVELPGRGTRARETPLTNLPALVEQVAEAIQACAGGPFAFFGHSMGALIAFEVARALRREGGIEPVHLFVSGREAPHVAGADPSFHALPDDELLQVLRDLKGTPDEVLENADLMQMLLPLLRADFALVESYRYSVEAPLRCAITAYGGTVDATVRIERLEAWRDQTTAPFTVRMIEGDHFFLHDAASSLLRGIAHDLAPSTSAFPSAP